MCQAPATQAEVNRHLDHGCPDPPLIHLDDSSDEKTEKKEDNDTKNQGGVVVQEKGNAGQASNILVQLGDYIIGRENFLGGFGFNVHSFSWYKS